MTEADIRSIQSREFDGNSWLMFNRNFLFYEMDENSFAVSAEIVPLGK